MKQKLKRFLAGFMAMLTILTTFATNGTTAFAASAQANMKIWFASSKATGEISELKAGYEHGRMFYHWIDGHASYCLNYSLSASNGQLMTSYEEPQTNLTDAQEKLLHYTLYYGHDYTDGNTEPSQTQKDEFAATQALVWGIVNNLYGTSQCDSMAQKICNAAYDPSYAYSYYETLRNQVTSAYYMGVPSFASKYKSSAETYELKWNESNGRFEITLTDTNDLLSGYDFSINGYKVEKDDNKLTISSTEVSFDEFIDILCLLKEKEASNIMSKVKKLLHKLSTGALSSVAALALMVTATNVSTCCWFILGQDKLPDNAKKLRKF